MTKLVTTGNYTDRNVLCWDTIETTRIIYEISKKFLEHDPEIKIGSEYYLRDKPNGLNLEDDIKTQFHRNVDFTKKVPYQSGSSNYYRSVNLVAMKVDKESCMAIKLNLGTSRSSRIEKRITPKSVEKLDDIVKLFADELNKSVKAQAQRFNESKKQYESNLEHSKTFPDFAEKLGFGRKEAPDDGYMGYGAGNYLGIKKEFNGTEIALQQREDGDFNIQLAKLDADKAKKLMELLK